jgi:hypothetical protein
MRLLPAIFANIALLASALGFGSLLRPLFPEKFSDIDRFALTLLGGFGILGTALFCVGQIWFSRSAILLVLLPGVLLSIRIFPGALRKCRTVFAMRSPPFLPLALISSVLIVTALGGFAEPIGDMNSDAIAYHYHGPKVWLRETVIRPVPDEILTSFPSAVETQFAALMSLGGTRAPGLFSLVCLISLLLIAASLSIRLGLDDRGVWWVIALIVSMPALYRGAYEGYVDVLFAGFLLAAARIAFDAVTLRQFTLFGIFCGISMGTKYTALISWVLLVFCCFLISALGRRQPHPFLAKNLLASCAVAIVVAAPFYLRNWMFFGCPIYPPPPIFLRIFPATKVLPSVLLEVQRNVLETGQGLGRSFGSFLLLPFNLTYHTADFRGAGGIGLAPLALGPLGLIACRKNLFARALVLFAFLQMIAWFVTAQVSRYAIHVYVLGAIFAVLGWQFVAHLGSKYARTLAALLVACSILYGLYMIVPERVEDMHAAVSAKFEDKRRHAEIPYLESFDYLNTEPSVSKVLILGPYVAPFYLDKAYVKPLGRWGEQTLPGATNLQAVLSQSHDLRVSHVLDVFPESGPLKLPENTPGLTLVFQGKDQRVYRVD